MGALGNRDDASAGLAAIPHRDRGRGAHALEPFHHLRPGVESGRHLRPRDPHVARIDEDERIGRIDQRDWNASRAFDLEVVEDVAGREERARARTTRVEELEIHRGAGTRYAGNRGFPFDGGASVLHREPGPDELAGVGVVDDDDAFRPGRFDHPLVHREGSDGRRHVSAVAAPVDLGTVHRDLAERVVHVRVGVRRRPDDADLGERRDATPHAVKLPPVGVRAPESGDEEALPARVVIGKMAAIEHYRVARAAAHEHGGDSQLAQGAGSDRRRL